MKTKLIEIRDDGIKIVALAIKTEGDNLTEQQFFEADNFGSNNVVLVCMKPQQVRYDPFAWDDTPYGDTMRAAHMYIKQHFDSLPNAAVVDVEYINGETDKPKMSEIWR